MLTRLFLLFIIVPTLELILLIQIGQVIGTLATIGLIMFTGILGAFLARRQGLQVLSRLRGDMQSGQLPTDALFDGVLVLIAGAFLMTPGILTDTVGFLCLIPFTRQRIKRLAWSRIERFVQQRQINIMPFQQPPYRHDEPEDVIILDPDEQS